MITPRITRLIRASDLRIFQEAVGDSIPDGWQARSTAIVVPARSAAEELRRTIEDRRLPAAGSDRRLPAGSGGALVFPDLVTRGELYAELHVHLRDAALMLSEFEREVLLRLAADDARAGGMKPPFQLRPGLVAAILSFYDELRRRGRTVDSLDRIIGEKLAAGRDAMDHVIERVSAPDDGLTPITDEARREAIASLESFSQAYSDHVADGPPSGLNADEWTGAMLSSAGGW